MKKEKYKFTLLLIATVDILFLFVSFLLAKYLVFNEVNSDLFSYGILISMQSILWFALSLHFDLFELPRIIYSHKIISKNLYVLLVFVFLSGGLLFFVTDYKFSRWFFMLTMGFFIFFMLSWRLILVYLLVRYRKKGYDQSNIVLVGMNKNIADLIQNIYTNKKYGFSIAGLFTDAEVTQELEKYHKGKLSEIFLFLGKHRIDEIIISLPYQYSELINKLFQFADNHMMRVRVIPEFSEYLSQAFEIDYVQNIPIMKLRSEPLNSVTNRIIKRTFDVFFSLFVIVFIFSWLFPIIAIIIKLTSKGPIFFVQQRTGKDGESFPCYKFRSMTVNKESDQLQATKDDVRITKFGAIMRKTSIDELPQIFNVLFNHMSLVGPRPHMIKHTEEYRKLVDKFMVRHFAKPGVTGWAQINGFRGQTKQVKDMKNRALADIWYIENWSFLLDIKIVFITAWSMFFKKDVNAY